MKSNNQVLPIQLIGTLSFLTGSKQKVTEYFCSLIRHQGTGLVLPCSLNDIAAFTHHKSLMSLYQSISYLTLDGMPLVWYAKYCKKISDVERVYGPTLMKEILIKVNKLQSIHHVFLAPSSSTKIALQLTLKRLQILPINSQFYTVPYPFDMPQWNTFTKKINLNTYSVIWIGLSSPLQLQLANYLKSQQPDCIVFCVGAAFDYIAQRKNQAPLFIQKIGLEWLFRLTTEPTRLWKRYLLDIPTALLKITYRHYFVS